ncbi:MAG: PolC-type DNA polymerase III [Elainellaceae cyanobacterium]
MLSVDWLHYYRRLANGLFVVVDLETTGGDCQRDRITEVSVLRASLKSGIQEQKTHLINPGVDIPEKIVHLTGITPEMVADQPTAEQVLPQCRAWLERGVLVGHNIAFDYGFLRAAFARQGRPFHKSSALQLCTVQMARLMLADLPSRRLPKLVKHFKFDVGASHRAAADAQACWMLLEMLLTDIQTKRDKTLLQRFRQEWIPLKVAARLLNCSCEDGFGLMAKADIPHRLSGRSTHKTPMYRRGHVEDLVCSQQGIQLSLV